MTNTIYTIGHSNHPLEKFLELLEEHAIEVLVDVRSQPFSRYVPHFNKPELEKALARKGIRYLFMGRELGGRPNDRSLYDEEGGVDYEKLSETPSFREGLARLIREAQKHRIACMCAEEDPAKCHRGWSIAPRLVKENIKVLHIRANRQTETQQEIDPRLPKRKRREPDPQASLPF
ncbi:MAG: DUF488 domain-containing protein [Geminicoccaceae bacterium]|nr:DUF488 domain-containing protein [Geminicoccaceae bacterium]MDW8341047.1 DUF488 domain-containing protein [Geminicoccaceae bacterium]